MAETVAELRGRIAELEARLAELQAELGARGPQPAESQLLPPLELKALRVLAHGWGSNWKLRPAPVKRSWMEELPSAYLCLPMVVANQWGWQILCPTDVTVFWNGDPSPQGLSIQVDPIYAPAIKSRFGGGIVTFSPPWLFRTPRGWDLYAKAPGNRWNANAAALEGIIETWWLNYTFTINWKLIEPGVARFHEGESLVQLVPVPHATFQGAVASESPIAAAEPESARELLRWLAERRRIEKEDVRTHKLYRKAEGVLDHVVKLSVPEIPPLEEPQSPQPPEDLDDEP